MRRCYVAILALLSFVLVVYGLKCRYCAVEKPHKGCLKKAAECYPRRGLTCISINIYYRGKLQFRTESCARNLRHCRQKLTNKKTGFSMNVTCCASRDFCNHWDKEERD
ncbi:uncharacterized protein LOC143834519 [Paroedura picta]|uniref:uncharacterized protein LOC143834519 n=1 Tax=Paroedura picta TaxID=143630 RepID=UPI004057924F